MTTKTTITRTETTGAVERVHADHAVVKRLGDWTRTGHIQVRVRQGLAVLDLRSPGLPDDIEVRVELQRATVKLLVPDDAVVEHWDLHWTARGKVKDAQDRTAGEPALAGARRIRLTGVATDSEVRVHRGGIAVLSAMCTRAYLQDLRLAHRTGGHPTVDDPARSHAH
ncbi:hypothetical protein ACWDFL_02395 [Streptomyces bungoensis]